MLYGIGPKHIRHLCENPFEGGCGYTPQQVAEFTIDQVFFRLCDSSVLRGGERNRRQTLGTPDTSALLKPDVDGLVAGRDRHGNPMRAKIIGESKARRLNRELEEAEASRSLKEQAEKRSGSRKSRRQRRRDRK